MLSRSIEDLFGRSSGTLDEGSFCRRRTFVRPYKVGRSAGT